MEKFRTLRADEIDCRIATVKNNGISLLLYKDARCDMNILDEAVGAFNWSRSHCRDNANCIVSIWDEGKRQWVSKEDTGTESFTEKEKGLASDSFKRACFNWGIGRELYTAPFIWISDDKCVIKSSGRKDQKGNDVLTCNDKFYVSNISYDSNRVINALQIKHSKTHKVVYELGKMENAETQNDSNKTEERKPITASMVKALRNRFEKNGIDEEKVLALYKLTELSKISIGQHTHLNQNFNELKARCSI